MDYIVDFLSLCWRMFEDVQVPLLDISFSSFWIGLFVTLVAFAVLRSLFGVGYRDYNNRR